MKHPVRSQASRAFSISIHEGTTIIGLLCYMHELGNPIFPKEDGNSNISPCKNIIFKKSSKRNQNPSRYYNYITNLKFQHKPEYHLSKILI